MVHPPSTLFRGPHSARSVPTLVGGLLFALASAACGGSEAASSQSETGLDAPDRMLSVTPEPVFTVGGFDAPEWAGFGDVSGVAFDGRGHLYVLDGQANVVTEIDDTGAFVRTIGRPGEGPGELSNPFSLAVLPDGEVGVFDFGHQAWVVYGPDGEYLRNVGVDVAEVGLPGRDVRPHPSGGVVGSIGGRIRMGPTPQAQAQPEAPSRPVAWFGLDEGDTARVVYRAWDLPDPPDGDEQSLTTSTGGNIRLRMPVLRAFEPSLEVSPLPDGRLAVVDSSGYRIKLVGLDGEVTGVLERPIEPMAVTGAIQERERQRRLDELESGEGGGATIMIRGGGGGGRVESGGMDDMMRGRIESMIFADEIPVIDRIAVDGAGRIWVERSAPDPSEPGPTDLLTADGRYLGTLPADGVRIPGAFGPDGLMVRIEEDEFDVPTLVVERMPEAIG